MSIDKSHDLFGCRVTESSLHILFSNIFACKLAWRLVNISSSICESKSWSDQKVLKQWCLKEISVYYQHTVGTRDHALLWSGQCVRYGKVYNKCKWKLTWLYGSDHILSKSGGSWSSIFKIAKSSKSFHWVNCSQHCNIDEN